VPDPALILAGPESLTAPLSHALLSQWRGSGLQNELTHGFHPRIAAMNPQTIQSLLSLVPAGGGVKDIFCGAGAVGIEVLRDGREFSGVDISGLAVGIARAQTWLPAADELALFRGLTVEAVAFAAEGEATQADPSALDIAGLREFLLRVAPPAPSLVLNALLFVLSYVEHDVFPTWRRFHPLSHRFEKVAAR
jgi:hypothetical protein